MIKHTPNTHAFDCYAVCVRDFIALDDSWDLVSEHNTQGAAQKAIAFKLAQLSGTSHNLEFGVFGVTKTYTPL